MLPPGPPCRGGSEPARTDVPLVEPWRATHQSLSRPLGPRIGGFHRPGGQGLFPFPPPCAPAARADNCAGHPPLPWPPPSPGRSPPDRSAARASEPHNPASCARPLLPSHKLVAFAPPRDPPRRRSLARRPSPYPAPCWHSVSLVEE